MSQTKTRKATAKDPAIMIRASKHVQHTADVLLHIGTLARRLAKAPPRDAAAATRLFINAVNSYLPSRATVAEGNTVLALVLEGLKGAGRSKPFRTDKPVDVDSALKLSVRTGALLDIYDETDHFEAVLKAFNYLRAYRLTGELAEIPAITLEDGARFIGRLRYMQSQVG